MDGNAGGSKDTYKVVVTRNLGPQVMPLLYDCKALEVVLWPHDAPCERTWLLENVQGAVGLLLMLVDKVDRELLDAAGPSLRVISTMSVGFDHVDCPLLSQRGVRLGYTPDVLTDAVADLAVMLALMAGRNVGETTKIVNEGRWPSFDWSPFNFCGPQLSTTSMSPTRTIGFLGFGRIAQATLARLVPFGITSCIYTTNPTSKPDPSLAVHIASKLGMRPDSISRVDLNTLASESDVLFVLAAGGEATRHLINEDFLGRMKKHAVLVNAARGTLVDSDALAKALRERWIWGAGLDVIEGEPNVRLDHPLVKEPRCVIVPHTASATIDTRLAMATTAAKNLIAGVFSENMPAELDLHISLSPNK